MANQSVTSMAAAHNQHHLDAVEELRSSDWEVVEGEDLYADVESLESFSISSEDEQEQEQEGTCADHDLHSQRDDCKIVVHVSGRDLGVTSSEHHYLHRDYGFDSSVGAFHSGDCDEDDGGLDGDMVGEPLDRDAVALVDQLGFHVSGGKVVDSDLGNPVLELVGESDGLNHGTCDEEGVDNGVIGESQTPIHQYMVMFTRSGGYVVPPHDLHADYVENHYHQDFLDQDDDDGDRGYEIDVDDELVPWGVANRLEKQRMRKLGKRTFARMNKSKKMAHFFTKSACLHGKHGFGLKAY